MKIDAQKENLVEQQQQPWTRRRMAMAGVLGMSVVFVSGCLGGGGGSDDDGVDLRAAYDRIQGGMTHEEVDRAVGVSPTNVPNDGRRRWIVGRENLDVTFANMGGGVWMVNGATWFVVGGGEVNKSFDVNLYK